MTATKMTRTEAKAQALAPLKEVVRKAWDAKRDLDTFRTNLERGLRMAHSWEVGRDAASAEDLRVYREKLLAFDVLMAERDRLVGELTAAGFRLSMLDRGVYLNEEAR